jgi:hypothetical protein
MPTQIADSNSPLSALHCTNLYSPTVTHSLYHYNAAQLESSHPDFSLRLLPPTARNFNCLQLQLLTTTFHCTDGTLCTELGRSNDIGSKRSERTRRKHSLQHLLYCCVTYHAITYSAKKRSSKYNIRYCCLTSQRFTESTCHMILHTAVTSHGHAIYSITSHGVPRDRYLGSQLARRLSSSNASSKSVTILVHSLPSNRSYCVDVVTLEITICDNYKTFTNLHTVEITMAHSMSSQSVMSSLAVAC